MHHHVIDGRTNHRGKWWDAVAKKRWGCTSSPNSFFSKCIQLSQTHTRLSRSAQDLQSLPDDSAGFTHQGNLIV